MLPNLKQIVAILCDARRTSSIEQTPRNQGASTEMRILQNVYFWMVSASRRTAKCSFHLPVEYTAFPRLNHKKTFSIQGAVKQFDKALRSKQLEDMHESIFQVAKISPLRGKTYIPMYHHPSTTVGQTSISFNMLKERDV